MTETQLEQLTLEFCRYRLHRVGMGRHFDVYWIRPLIEQFRSTHVYGVRLGDVTNSAILHNLPVSTKLKMSHDLNTREIDYVSARMALVCPGVAGVVLNGRLSFHGRDQCSKVFLRLILYYVLNGSIDYV